MKIKVNENTRIEYNAGNWIIREEKGLDKEGKPLSSIIGYYTTVEGAVKSAFNKKLAKSTANLESVEELVGIYEKQAKKFFDKLEVVAE